MDPKTLAVFLVVTVSLSAQFTLTEDFTAGASALSAWKSTSGGFKISGAGGLEGKSPPDTKDFLVLQQAPVSKHITIEAQIKLISRHPDAKGWTQGGIVIYADNRNYWALLISSAPSDDANYAALPFRFELNERYTNVWLAQGTPAHKLERIKPANKSPVIPALNRSYAVKLILDSEKILATVTDGDTLVYQEQYNFGGASAVMAGRPALMVNGAKMQFSELKIRCE